MKKSCILPSHLRFVALALAIAAGHVLAQDPASNPNLETCPALLAPQQCCSGNRTGDESRLRFVPIAAGGTSATGTVVVDVQFQNYNNAALATNAVTVVPRYWSAASKSYKPINVPAVKNDVPVPGKEYFTKTLTLNRSQVTDPPASSSSARSRVVQPLDDTPNIALFTTIVDPTQSQTLKDACRVVFKAGGPTGAPGPTGPTTGAGSANTKKPKSQN